MKFEEIASRFKGLKKTSKGYMACCPAHDDRTPSLAITRAEDKTLIKCFADCETERILAPVGLDMKDLFDDERETAVRLSARRKPAALKAPDGADAPSGEPRPESRLVDVYQYTTAEGKLVYEKLRYEPKDFRVRRPDGSGGFVWNLRGIGLVPYRLPEIVAAMDGVAEPLIVLTEGEKDCERLRWLGDPDYLAAEGIAVSSFKEWKPEFNGHIVGSRVVVLCDHDEGGRSQAERAAEVIAKAARSVRVVDLHEGEPEFAGQDVTDWIEARRAEVSDADFHKEEIFYILRSKWESAPEWRLPGAARLGAGLEIEYLSTVTAKQISWLCAPLIPYGFYTLLDGVEGIGKTYAMLDLAKRLTRGEPMPFNGERREPANVLFLSVEDSPEYILRPRFERMGGDLGRLAVLRGLFEFDAAGFANLEDTIERHGIKFVLIDPLFSFAGRADINSTADVRPITDRLNTIAANYEIALVGIRHVSKSKGYGDPANAGAHSRAWRQGCRSGLFIGHDAADKSKRGIAQTKLNVAAESKIVYGFEIDPDGVFRWTGESDLSVPEMLAQVSNESNEDRSAKADAVEFLREMLSDGWKTKGEIDEGARGAGISFSTLNRAKKALGIQPRKSGLGGWVWELPEHSQN